MSWGFVSHGFFLQLSLGARGCPAPVLTGVFTWLRGYRRVRKGSHFFSVPRISLLYYSCSLCDLSLLTVFSFHFCLAHLCFTRVIALGKPQFASDGCHSWCTASPTVAPHVSWPGRFLLCWIAGPCRRPRSSLYIAIWVSTGVIWDAALPYWFLMAAHVAWCHVASLCV